MEKGVAPSYEVKLADGTKIDFDARGEWTDVERPGGVVPDGLIPQPILKFVAANYPGRHVRVSNATAATMRSPSTTDWN